MSLKRLLSGSVTSILIIQSLLPLGLNSPVWAVGNDQEEDKKPIFYSSQPLSHQRKRENREEEVSQQEALVLGEPSSKKLRLEETRESVSSMSTMPLVYKTTLEDLPYEILEHISTYTYPDKAQSLYHLGAVNRGMLDWALKTLEWHYPASFFQNWSSWRFKDIDKERVDDPHTPQETSIRFRIGIGNVALHALLSLPFYAVEFHSLKEYQQAKNLLTLIPTENNHQEEKLYLNELIFKKEVSTDYPALSFMHEVNAQDIEMNPNARNLYAVWKATNREDLLREINPLVIQSAAQAIQRVITNNGLTKFFYTQGIDTITKIIFWSLRVLWQEEGVTEEEKGLNKLYASILEATVPLGYYRPAHLYFFPDNLTGSSVLEIAQAARLLQPLDIINNEHKVDEILNQLNSIDTNLYPIAKGYIIQQKASAYNIKASHSNNIEDFRNFFNINQDYISFLTKLLI